MQTRTGSFPIGLRRSGGAWMDNLSEFSAWAKASDIGVIDLGADGDVTIQAVVEAGLSVGSVDLPDWKGMISPDATTRDAAVARSISYIEACSVHGPMHHFVLMLPEDPGHPRLKNFDLMIDSYSALAPALEANQADLAIEGYPGPGALCCTPADLRAFFDACPSSVFGINYDPSHLLRQGIDHIRFLREFGERVTHVHGKDTELLTEELYEFGHEQPATFVSKFAFGGWAWRYTIPGQGSIRWGAALAILAQLGYAGTISIELEDASFNGAEESGKAGILAGARFLAGC